MQKKYSYFIVLTWNSNLYNTGNFRLNSHSFRKQFASIGLLGIVWEIEFFSSERLCNVYFLYYFKDTNLPLASTFIFSRKM